MTSPVQATAAADHVEAGRHAATAPVERRAVDKATAAQLLGIGVLKLEQLIGSGDLRAVKLGHKTLRIPVTELDAFIERKLAERYGTSDAPEMSS